MGNYKSLELRMEVSPDGYDGHEDFEGTFLQIGVQFIKFLRAIGKDPVQMELEEEELDNLMYHGGDDDINLHPQPRVLVSRPPSHHLEKRIDYKHKLNISRIWGQLHLLHDGEISEIQVMEKIDLEELRDGIQKGDLSAVYAAYILNYLDLNPDSSLLKIPTNLLSQM